MESSWFMFGIYSGNSEGTKLWCWAGNQFKCSGMSMIGCLLPLALAMACSSSNQGFQNQKMTGIAAVMVPRVIPVMGVCIFQPGVSQQHQNSAFSFTPGRSSKVCCNIWKWLHDTSILMARTFPASRSLTCKVSYQLSPWSEPFYGSISDTLYFPCPLWKHSWEFQHVVLSRTVLYIYPEFIYFDIIILHLKEISCIIDLFPC